MLILRKEAEKDIKEAYNWYEDQQIHLGTSFLSEIEAALEIIQETPKLYGCVYRSTRRALCKRFPYAIYYIENSSNIVVLAVMKQSRDPATWQKRF